MRDSFTLLFSLMGKNIPAIFTGYNTHEGVHPLLWSGSSQKKSLKGGKT